MRVAPRTVSSKHPPRSWSMSRPKTGSESNRGQHIQSIEPDRDVRAAVLQSPSRPYSRSGDGCHRPAGGRCQLMRPILSAGASRRYSPHESRIPARVILLGPEPSEVTDSRIGLLVQACEATAGLIGERTAQCIVHQRLDRPSLNEPRRLPPGRSDRHGGAPGCPSSALHLR